MRDHTADIEGLRSVFELDPNRGMIRRIKRPTRASGGSGYVGWNDGPFWQRPPVSVGYKGRTVTAPVLAWVLFYGEWPPGQVIALNGDRSDVRPENLALRASVSTDSVPRRRRVRKVVADADAVTAAIAAVRDEASRRAEALQAEIAVLKMAIAGLMAHGVAAMPAIDSSQPHQA